MSKLAVAILGRLVFANYNAFGLGSIALFFTVGLALLLGGGHGKPNTLHVASAEPASTSLSLSKGSVAGAVTLTPSSEGSAPQSAPPSTSAVPPPQPKKKDITLSQAVPPPYIPPVFMPPTINPQPEPTPPPIVPDPTPLPPPPPVVPFSITGPSTITITLGGSVVVPFSTSDNSMVTWQLASGANVGSIFILPDADPVLAASYTFSLVAQPTALVGDTKTFTVHITDTTRGIDVTKSIIATIVAAPTPPPPPVTP